MSELGAALGCDAILTANLARLDDTYQGSLRVLSARDGKTLADEPIEANGQKALARELEAAALRLVKKLRPPPPLPPPASARALSWVPLAASVALGVGAGVTLGLANSNYAQVPSVGEARAVRLAEDGSALQAAGLTMAGAGALAGAVLMFALGGQPNVTPQVSVMGSSAAFGLSGVFP